MTDNKSKIRQGTDLVFASVVIVLLIAWTTGPFFYHFADGRLVDLYSFFQLLLTAFVSFFACRILEKKHSLKWYENPSARPFFVSAVGFLFLWFDDFLSIHENIDKFIHLILRIKETALTDHIDDFIILAYGIIAAFFIKDFIREFRRHPYMMRFIFSGLFLFFTMFCLDFLTNNIETFSYFLFKDFLLDDAIHIQNIFKMLEESFELLGEAYFLSAFVAAFIDIKTGNI